MPGMMMKDKKPMSYKKGGMVAKPAATPKAPAGAKPMSYMKGGMVKKPMMPKAKKGM